MYAVVMDSMTQLRMGRILGLPGRVHCGVTFITTKVMCVCMDVYFLDGSYCSNLAVTKVLSPFLAIWRNPAKL